MIWRRSEVAATERGKKTGTNVEEGGLMEGERRYEPGLRDGQAAR